MLQELLKTQTASLHEQLEQLLYVNDIMQRKLNVQQYQKLLISNYLIHQRYENAILEKIDGETAKNIMVSSRKKLAALELDLMNADIKPTAVENLITTAIDQIPNSAFAMGALYVLEGATLGGSVILKQLQLNPNFIPDQDFNYYGVYGKELIPKWQNFITELNKLPEEDYPDAIAGAKFIFKEIAKIAKKVNESYQLS